MTEDAKIEVKKVLDRINRSRHWHYSNLHGELVMTEKDFHLDMDAIEQELKHI